MKARQGKPAWSASQQPAELCARADLDEIGYPPMNREEASLFFRLLERRYEKRIIPTSNKGFADWGDEFGDNVLATAILDRLLHHQLDAEYQGESYRLREKRSRRVEQKSGARKQRGIAGEKRSTWLMNSGH